MYIPKNFEERDRTVLHALVAAHPLGAWVVQAEGGLVVNHLPFLLDATRGPLGTLTAHLARANPVWKALAGSAASVAIFQGPQGYISPSWYPGKAEHGRTVPTWNYAVVHAHGVPRVMDDRDWLLRHVTRLTEVHEAGAAAPWQVSDAPRDYIEQQLGAIVGIEIPIAALDGKWKMSQNRTMPDRLGVVAGLSARGDADAVALAALVQERVAGSQRDG